MIWFVVISHLILCTVANDVSTLNGKPGFRSIDLKWSYADKKEPSGFSISYCENQVWGKFRCKKEILSGEKLNEITKQKLSNGHLYQTQLNGLRMATNYTVQVRPFLGDAPPTENRARSLPNEIYVQTKGFSARAINCLANNSMVEVETGPYFGGKISVEGSMDERCGVQGNYSPTKTSYLVNINHYICGSEIFNTSVRTFIIVQENLPILTHSTRRFMVVCTYVPETFTVRAGVNLPYDNNGPEDQNSLLPIGSDVVEVDPSELFDSTNQLSPLRGRDVGRALRLSTDHGTKDSKKWSHLVLMVVMIVSALVGLLIAAWKFMGHHKKRTTMAFDSSVSTLSPCDMDASVPVGVATIEGAFLESEFEDIANDMNILQGGPHVAFPAEDLHPNLIHEPPYIEGSDVLLDPISLTDLTIHTGHLPHDHLMDLHLNSNVLVSEVQSANDSLDGSDILPAQFNEIPHIMPLGVDPNDEIPIFENRLVPPMIHSVDDSEDDAQVESRMRPEDGNWRLKNEKGQIFAPKDPTV